VELALTRRDTDDPGELLDQLLAFLWAEMPAGGQRDDVAMLAITRTAG
jgi:hypothetical protein